MSKLLVFFSVLLTVSESAVIPTRFRRQYGWGGSPYYGNAQYYETQPQQWSSQYQNNQNYYSPYFYGYQRQHSWQSSNQNHNTYQSQYNRPSWISENNNGYVTAPSAYNQVNEGGYGRPKYLATMQPKPTLSPVILERSTLFVTPMPTVQPTENGRHPTFLERLGVTTLPIEPTLTESEEEALRSAEEEIGTLGNRELLPGRASEENKSEEEKTTTVPSVTEETIESTSEPSVMEKDEISSSDFFASSTENTVSSEITEQLTSTDPSTTSEVTKTTEVSASTSTETTTTETTTLPTTTTATQETTTATATPSSTTTESITTTISTTPALVPDVKPVTLLAFQEVTSNPVNVTQPTVDQSTSVGDLNVIGEGSGSEDATTDENTSRPTFVTGIVGLRAPPVPKSTDPEKVGLEVVEWTDSDNEVRKVLLTK